MTTTGSTGDVLNTLDVTESFAPTGVLMGVRLRKTRSTAEYLVVREVPLKKNEGENTMSTYAVRPTPSNPLSEFLAAVASSTRPTEAQYDAALESLLDTILARTHPRRAIIANASVNEYLEWIIEGTVSATLDDVIEWRDAKVHELRVGRKQ